MQVETNVLQHGADEIVLLFSLSTGFMFELFLLVEVNGFNSPARSVRQIMKCHHSLSTLPVARHSACQENIVVMLCLWYASSTGPGRPQDDRHRLSEIRSNRHVLWRISRVPHQNRVSQE